VLLTVRNVLLFPYILTPIFVDDPHDVKKLQKAYEGNRLVGHRVHAGRRMARVYCGRGGGG
ncbi:MAG: hypothetical protein IJ982_08310, partial [Fibrobacter sp.]|nr:hypothetical protein [Fibrobacter sp.]